MDIDEDLLVRSAYNAEPYMADYLKLRDHSLTVEVFCGSIDAYDACLEDTDFVFGIEMWVNGVSAHPKRLSGINNFQSHHSHRIEHLFPGTLENTPYNIFGRMRPKCVVLTTPNSDYNVLFDMVTPFRHDDHKFEWSREQFVDW